MTRTNRRRFLVLFAAIAALLALSGALALPETAQAQSAGVLVSNIGQTSDGTATINSGSLVAQGFKVASGGGNYTLTSIEVPVDLFGISALTTADLALLSARLWSADAFGEPVSSLHQLTNPPSISDGDTATFTAPSGVDAPGGEHLRDRVDLWQGYWRIQGLGRRRQRVTKTRPPLTGWTIADTSLHWREDYGNTSWSSRTTFIHGKSASTALRGPATLPPLSTDATLSGLVGDRRRHGPDADASRRTCTDYTASVANDCRRGDGDGGRRPIPARRSTIWTGATRRSPTGARRTASR